MTQHSFRKDFEQRKRLYEVAVAIFTTALLLFLSRLETHLFSLSETLSIDREFLTTLAYFALININVILILFLSFLIFRNVAKLILERRKGVLGSKLRTKLVVALVFFALAPTVLLFYVSMQFITTSFETWFSEKVKITMQQTREAGSHVYKQDQKRLESLARIALKRVEILGPQEIFETEASGLEVGSLPDFDVEYGLSAVRLFDANARLIWASDDYSNQIGNQTGESVLLESIHFFMANPDSLTFSKVVGENDQDVVKAFAPVKAEGSKRLLGVVQTEVRFETQILKSVETILSDFANLKPGAQLIRLSYMILMVVMTLLIVFSATWLGFYVARGISGPLQSLAEATREIALGNYNINLQSKNDDETGQLVKAFNVMASDLRDHERSNRAVQEDLRRTNDELDRRGRYMATVLKHISAGVVATDASDHITSFNPSAEKLLGLKAEDVVGRHPEVAFGYSLLNTFWLPIVNEGIGEIRSARKTLDLSKIGRDVTLLVDVSRIFDESGIEIGKVVVFDDARVQVMLQRVAAWREVARRIAHEIKNPITPIKLNAQRMLRRFHDKFEKSDQEVFNSCIEMIITQVDSLRDLVNEFSKFSRLPAIQPKMADLNELIQDAVRLFRMSYPDVVFVCDNLGQLPRFPIDKEQMNRVFVNLMANSLAAMVEGRAGRIEVKSEYLKELSTVRIEVSDNGCGIPRALRNRVLEPYFSTKDEGTGLGLAIVHQIVTDHRGYLRLIGNEPHGTVVIIELPVS